MLGTLDMDIETSKYELPNEEDGATNANDISMKTSEALLKKGLGFTWEKTFFDKDGIWLICCDNVENTTDNIP